MDERVENLSETIKKQRAGKYDVNLEIKIRQWISERLGDYKELCLNKELGLAELLSDGIILCKLINTIANKKLTNPSTMKTAFKQMENISSYLLACTKLGMNQTELFETLDLYESRDLNLVLLNLHALIFIDQKYKDSLQSKVLDSDTPSSSQNIGDKKVSRLLSGKDQSPGVVSPKRSISMKQISSSPIRSEKTKDLKPSVTSLEDDVVTKDEFKYNPALEDAAKKWISEVLNVPTPDVSIAAWLKSGVILCQLVNIIKPGSVNSIYDKNLSYRQMENIEHYLKACSSLGIPHMDLFETSDLFNEKNINSVINNIHVLAMHIQKHNEWKGPTIQDVRDTKSLFSATLTGGNLDQIQVIEEALTPEQEELLEWANTRFSSKGLSTRFENLSSDMKTGVKLIEFLKVIFNVAFIGPYHDSPSQVWHAMQNASLILRYIALQTFEKVEGCRPTDIVTGRSASITKLLIYLRDKFDLEYYYLKLIGDLSSDPDGISLEPTEDNYYEFDLQDEKLPENFQGLVSDEDLKAALKEIDQEKHDIKSTTLSPKESHQEAPPEEIKEVAETPSVNVPDEEDTPKTRKQSLKKQNNERKSLSPSKLRKKTSSPSKKSSDKKKEKKTKKKSRHSHGDIKSKQVEFETQSDDGSKDKDSLQNNSPVESVESTTEIPTLHEEAMNSGAGNNTADVPPETDLVPPEGKKVDSAVPKRIRIHASKVSSGSFAKAQKISRAQTMVRQHIINEICDTEVNYVKSLTTLKESFLEPLKKSNILSQETYFALFSNLEEILNHHVPFSALLNTRLQEWNERSIISDIFLNHTGFIRNYRSYLENYSKGMVTMYHVKKNYPEFVRMLHAFETDLLKTAMYTIDSFLIMPVQRIPRYILLLREMRKYTAENSEEWLQLERASNSIDKMLIELNAGIDHQASERLQKVITIMEKIQGETLLTNKDNTYLREGSLVIKKCAPKDKSSTSKEERKKLKGLKSYCFLFDKLLVICEPIKNATNDDEKQYQLVHQYPLEAIIDIKAEKDILESKVDYWNGFKMKHYDKKAKEIQFYLALETNMLVVHAPDGQQTEGWVCEFKKLLNV